MNGGAGTDTLKISDNTGTVVLPNLSNVEIIEVTGTAGVIVDTTAITDVTNLNIVKVGAAGAINADAGAGTDVSVAMKAAGAAVDIDGGNNVTVKLTDVAANTNAVTIGTDTDGGGADLGVAAAGNVVVEMTGKAYTAASTAATLSNVTVTGGKTISVTQKAAADTAAAAADITNTGNGVTQGNITIIGNANTTEVTVKQDAGVNATNATFKTGGVTETASVKFSAMTAGQTVILGGLTFTAATALTAAEAAAAFANLAAGIVPDTVGGAPFDPLSAGDTQGSGLVAKGVYSGALTGWTSGAATGDTVVFTSTTTNSNVGPLSNTGSVTPVVTAIDGKAHDAGASGGKMGVIAGVVSVTDANGTIKTITIDGVGNGSTTTTTTVLETLNVSNQAAAATFVVADTADTLALNLEKIGTAAGDATLTFTAAPTTLNVKSTGNNYVALTAAATTALNVSGTGTLKASANDLTALATVKVTESAGLTLNAGVADTLTSVDTTGTTGTVTVSIDGTQATYAGGAGKDIVTLTTAAPTKVINTGAGDDRVVLANGTTAIGTGGAIEGGDGTDTLVFTTTADAATASGGATFATKVTGFERLELRGATGAQAVDVAALGNYNDVTVTAGAGGAATLTLNNLSSGATIRLNDAVDATNATDAIVANIKDAATNTADVLNVAITANVAANATADDHGKITAAGVETVNISVTDGIIQTPTNAAPDVQNLTLVAVDATTIKVTGDTALNLATGTNQKVTLIDASELKAGLTVTAAGGVATTIKGGTGNDVLIASTAAAAIGTANATGVAATLTNDVVPGVTPVTAQNAVYVLDLTGAVTNDDGDTVTFDNGGAVGTYTEASGGSSDATAIAAALVVAGTIAIGGITYDIAAVAGQPTQIRLTAQTAADVSANMTITVVDDAAEGGITQPTTASQAITTEGKAVVAGTKEQATLAVAAEFSNSGADDLDQGDSISLTVAGTKYTYTVTAATETVDSANGKLLDLIKANAAIDATSSYNAGTKTFTFVAAAPSATNLAIGSDFTVTDLATGAATADILIGGAGNDILVANAGLSKLTGGEGNDLFVVGTASTNVNSYSTVEDFQAGDLLKIVGATTFKSAKVDLGDTAVFQDLANAAMVNLAAGEAGWFQFGGNTYVVMDAGADSTTVFVNAQDYIVKLTGLVDLSNASFNVEHSTIALV